MKIDSLIPILTPTTRGDNNLGDTFIGIGLQYLFERVIESPKWLLVNKYNYNDAKILESYIREAGFLIFAGMPQYHNFNQGTEWHDDLLWTDMVKPWDIRMFTMAGGAGSQGPNITPEQFIEYCHTGGDKTKELLEYRKQYSVAITTRDIYAHSLLLHSGIDNSHLPCGATFSSWYCNIRPAGTREYLALVLPQSMTISLASLPSDYRAKWHVFRESLSKDDATLDLKRCLQEYEEELRRAFLIERFTDIYKNLKVDHKVKVICHEQKEFSLLKSFIPMEDLFFSTDYFATLKFYAQCHTVISGRLHGSLPAYGIVGTKVINTAVDIRGNSVKIFPKITNLSLDDFTIENIRSALQVVQPSELGDFGKYLLRYDEVITQGFDKLKLK